MFPPVQVTKIAIGTGDGVTKDFSIKALFIIPNSETIYVNNMALTRGTDYEIDYENNLRYAKIYTAGLTAGWTMSAEI